MQAERIVLRVELTAPYPAILPTLQQSLRGNLQCHRTLIRMCLLANRPHYQSNLRTAGVVISYPIDFTSESASSLVFVNPSRCPIESIEPVIPSISLGVFAPGVALEVFAPNV